MLEVHQLTYSYGDTTAVNNISFTIAKNEVIGLLGHNGAGKTTVMKMLSGCLEPDQGWIKVNGINLSLASKKIQKDIGYLSENLPLYPEMTVAGYLDYIAALKGLKNSLKWGEIRRIAQAVNINDRLLDPISKLSRGYKQRVGVAQAILGKPKLLILDEPSNGLDPAQTEHMRKLIRSFAKEATILLSTHIMQEVSANCDRVLILLDGRLVVNESLAALRQSNHLLLMTNIKLDKVRQLLQKIKGIEKICPLHNKNEKKTAKTKRYRISTETKKRDTISNDIARAIIESGGALYRLQPEHRDLETLFRQVNEEASLVDTKTKVVVAA